MTSTVKKALIAMVLAASASAVYAACTSHSITSGGRYVYCTTCCDAGSCSTTCY